MKVAASKVQICIFWKTPLSYDEIGSWPADVRAMWEAFGSVITKLRSRHGNSVPVEMYICPTTIAENAVIVAQNRLDPSLLPAANLYAEYPDGTGGQYFLSMSLSERFTGIQWTAAEVEPYVKALLYRSKPSESSLLCKLLPPLCNVGGWIWLAAAAAATLKASNSSGKTAQFVWGAGAFVLWKEWADRGGVQQLKETVGIGKYYDDVTIRPGSRVDSYWKGLKPKPSKYGVEEISAPYYSNVSEAIKHFGLYSIEFGNWLNQEERLNFMYATLVTIRDIAKVVGLNHAEMGLHKKLSLAFGSRGRGGFAAAFYQPTYNVINLTKTKGRGTFCHEYAHAVDYFLGVNSDGGSVRKQPNYEGKRKGSTPWLFEKVLDGILWNADGTPSSYHKYLEGRGNYLNQRQEIFARVCETYFYTKFRDLGIRNTWGVVMRPDMPSSKLVDKVAPDLKKIFQKIR